MRDDYSQFSRLIIDCLKRDGSLVASSKPPSHGSSPMSDRGDRRPVHRAEPRLSYHELGIARKPGSRHLENG